MLIALGVAMGIKPVVTAIIGQAFWSIGGKAIKDYHGPPASYISVYK
jgi:chromate transport protein ChrA